MTSETKTHELNKTAESINGGDACRWSCFCGHSEVAWSTLTETAGDVAIAAFDRHVEDAGGDAVEGGVLDRGLRDVPEIQWVKVRAGLYKSEDGRFEVERHDDSGLWETRDTARFCVTKRHGFYMQRDEWAIEIVSSTQHETGRDAKARARAFLLWPEGERNAVDAMIVAMRKGYHRPTLSYLDPALVLSHIARFLIGDTGVEDVTDEERAAIRTALVVSERRAGVR